MRPEISDRAKNLSDQLYACQEFIPNYIRDKSWEMSYPQPDRPAQKRMIGSFAGDYLRGPLALLIDKTCEALSFCAYCVSRMTKGC